MIDSSDGLISSAHIRITHIGTGEVRRPVTTGTAEFTIANLPPGIYNLTVEKAGFRTLQEGRLELQVDQLARLELKLDVGSVSETVEVTAPMPVLNTETGFRGDVVTSQEIAEIPPRRPRLHRPRATHT